MGRQLATIQRVSDISPIPGADKIEVASVLGWKVVIQKESFKENDLVVMIEIDSFLPIRPEFEFLRKSCYKKLENGQEGFRIRTVRLRQQISQGLLLPLSILEGTSFPNDTRENKTYEFKEGDTVSTLLNITLYQPPIAACLAGKVKGPFPSFLAKTDETRVQVLQNVLTRYKGTHCYISEKIDGASATFFLKDGEFGVCSRNLELLETPENSFWKIARELKIEEKLRQFGKNMAIQGELAGHGIQNNPLNLEGKRLFFFNVFNIDLFKYYDFSDAEEIISILGFDLEFVPIIDYFNLVDDIPKLIAMSVGKSVINPTKEREGIVIRPIVEKVDLEMSNEFSNGRVSFKSINPVYLLKEE